jgi:hypothetical protein
MRPKGPRGNRPLDEAQKRGLPRSRCAPERLGHRFAAFAKAHDITAIITIRRSSISIRKSPVFSHLRQVQDRLNVAAKSGPDTSDLDRYKVFDYSNPARKSVYNDRRGSRESLLARHRGHTASRSRRKWTRISRQPLMRQSAWEKRRAPRDVAPPLNQRENCQFETDRSSARKMINRHLRFRSIR